MTTNNDKLNTLINNSRIKHSLSNYEIKIIEENYNIDAIKYISMDIDHDGYDQFGSKSDLFTFKIYHIESGKLFKSIWYRENWYDGKNMDYFLMKKKEIKNNIKKK